MNKTTTSKFITRRAETVAERPNQTLYELNFATLFFANPETEFPTDLFEHDAYEFFFQIQQFIIEYIRANYDDTATL